MSSSGLGDELKSLHGLWGVLDTWKKMYCKGRDFEIYTGRKNK